MSMKWMCRFASSIFFLSASASVFSMSAIATPGTVNTLGNTTIGQHLLSVTHNPAACAQVFAPKHHFRMGYLSSLGATVEMGQVDNFEQDIDALVDLLDDTDVSLDAANALSDRFNAVLTELDQYGYLKAGFDISIPGLPLAIHRDAWVGSICAEGLVAVQFKAAVMSDALTYTASNINNNVEVDFSTDSSLLLKSAQLTQLGVDYARPVYQQDQGALSGQLLAGARLNFYSMKLSRQVVAFESFEDEDVGDVIQDEYDHNQQANNDVGVDLGLSWIGKKYQLGFTLANINEPSFDYGDFITDCAQFGTQLAQNNCQVANGFIASGQLDQQSDYVMQMMGTLDATYWLMSRWVVAGSYDLMDFEDPMGDELQWASLATAYIPMSRWIPSFRLGYRKNLAGESLASVNMGATLFGIFNLDLLYGLDNVEVDGNEMPRIVGIHVGFEQKF